MATVGTMTLDGRRVLVVGASSGIGREVGLQAAGAGAAVAFAARRRELLDEIVRGCAGEAVAIGCDVRVPDECEELVDTAIGALGGLDTLVYAAGTSPLAPLRRADANLWHLVVETNLVGAVLVTAATLPHLLSAAGRAIYLSSSSVGRPWPGLVPYAVTKAGLEEFVRGLRAEHPDLRVSRVVVGPTRTGFADGWDATLATEMFPVWSAGGYLPATTVALTPAETAAQIVSVIASPVRIDDLTVMPVIGPEPAQAKTPDATT